MSTSRFSTVISFLHAVEKFSKKHSSLPAYCGSLSCHGARHDQLLQLLIIVLHIIELRFIWLQIVMLCKFFSVYRPIKKPISKVEKWISWFKICIAWPNCLVGFATNCNWSIRITYSDKVDGHSIGCLENNLRCLT